MIDFATQEDIDRLRSFSPEEQQLVLAAVSVQRRMRLSDGAFAKQLGIRRPTWHNIKNAKRHPGLEFVRGLGKAFPMLEPEVDAFLFGADMHNGPTKRRTALS